MTSLLRIHRCAPLARAWFSARKLVARIRWHLNHRIRYLLPVLNRCRSALTVVNAFGSPGDVLLTATFVRNLKKKYPGLRINLITPHAEIVAHDPHIQFFNRPESFFAIRFWYLDILLAKDGETHVLAASCRHAGLGEFDAAAAVYLTSQETSWARSLAAGHVRPIITINVMSRELVKVWPVACWKIVLDELAKDYSVVQLGADDEPRLDGVRRLAGELSFRESMAFLSQAALHIGPDSFLMHAANGVGTPAVIIFGGSRTPRNLGYRENTDLFRQMPCGPCYIHTSKGQRCEHDIKCMREISPQEVLAAVREKAKAKFSRSIRPVAPSPAPFVAETTAS